MGNTITITPSGISIASPLVAGTQLSVAATGMEVAEDATLFLIVTSRFPDLLIASCPLSETTTEGEHAGTLYTATKQMSLFLVNARADEARSASIELVDTAHGASLARTTVPIYNSSLIPQPCRWPSASPLYVPGPAATVLVGTTTTLPPGSPATVENVGTTSDAVFNFGIPKGDKGDTGDPQPSDIEPLMDGAASPGISDDYSRADHRHPTDTTRQAVIEDLATIRSGAAAGATAVQQDNIAPQWSASATYPPDSCVFREGVLFFSVKQTGPGWNENDWIVPPNGVVQRINGSIDSLAVAVNQVSGALSNKQDIIPDLATIRSGAAAGATAVQPAALDAYRTAEAQNTIDNIQAERIGIVEQSAQSALNGLDVLDKNKANATSLAPEFYEGSTYALGDYCTRWGFLYQCTTAVTTPGAWNAANWTEVAVTDETASLLRYSFASPAPSVSGTRAKVACEDRAINDFTVATGITSLTIAPPAAVTGRARDFFCRITLTDSSLPTVTLPAGQTVDIGQSEINGMTQGVNLLMFTEIASGHWLASRRSAS